MGNTQCPLGRVAPNAPHGCCGFGLMAREKRDDARRLLAQGINPGEHRKATKRARADLTANSFETVAREWFAQFASQWTAGHGERHLRRLEQDVFLGKTPVAEITAPELLSVLRRIESRGAAETVRRVRQKCGQIFRYVALTPWL